MEAGNTGAIIRVSPLENVLYPEPEKIGQPVQAKCSVYVLLINFHSDPRWPWSDRNQRRARNKKNYLANGFFLIYLLCFGCGSFSSPIHIIIRHILMPHSWRPSSGWPPSRNTTQHESNMRKKLVKNRFVQGETENLRVFKRSTFLNLYSRSHTCQNIPPNSVDFHFLMGALPETNGQSCENSHQIKR